MADGLLVEESVVLNTEVDRDAVSFTHRSRPPRAALSTYLHCVTLHGLSHSARSFFFNSVSRSGGSRDSMFLASRVIVA